MDLIAQLFDFIRHIDRHMVDIVNDYQAWTYVILFVIIFAETGLVVTPFLPGDSVLFATGVILAKQESQLSVWIMLVLLIAAAVLGDFVNYEIGKYFGKRLFKPDSKIFKPSYLLKTEQFYEKYGVKTIIYARFVPIVRTFAPFIAGIGKMPYSRFGSYNIIGGVLWVSLFLLTGYFFGQISFIQHNFSLVILLIITISVIPPVVEIVRNKSK
ncbi:SNARE-like domain protein [Sphingobacterium spiritivorum ATCC 33300]|uniref:SNARE-like domain protein n=1 Tax=Sphingobacterium spiritivorum ATCC 33300 TaxID=525372 RepID=C2G1M5_SPHSI|nr:DedA family protein [Sphingobacterium spiritivorum]EEI90934.1 SNARE-like domain protein [Sphingobacterium spiritivorum ATCC 33300]QQS97818.1 DedA family protein [Sphingobacterium spiritivorum]